MDLSLEVSQGPEKAFVMGILRSLGPSSAAGEKMTNTLADVPAQQE